VSEDRRAEPNGGYLARCEGLIVLPTRLTHPTHLTHLTHQTYLTHQTFYPSVSWLI